MKNRKVWISVSVLVLIAIVAFCIGITLTNSTANRQFQNQLDKGKQYLSAMNYEQAIAAYQAALEIDPNNADAYLGLAEVYLAMGKQEQASQIIKEGYEKTQDERLTAKQLELEHLILSASNDQISGTDVEETSNDATTAENSMSEESSAELEDPAEKAKQLYALLEKDPENEEVILALLKAAYKFKYNNEMNEAFIMPKSSNAFRGKLKTLLHDKMLEHHCKFARVIYKQDANPMSADYCNIYCHDENNLIVYAPIVGNTSRGVEYKDLVYRYDETGKWLGTEYYRNANYLISNDEDWRKENIKPKYDKNNRLVKDDDSYMGNEYSYNADGSVTKIKYSKGSKDGLISTQYIYNNEGFLIKEIETDEFGTNTTEYDEGSYLKVLMANKEDPLSVFGHFDPCETIYTQAYEADGTEKPAETPEVTIPTTDELLNHNALAKIEHYESGDARIYLYVPYQYGDGFMDVFQFTIYYHANSSKWGTYVSIDHSRYVVYYFPE